MKQLLITVSAMALASELVYSHTCFAKFGGEQQHADHMSVHELLELQGLSSKR